MDARRLRQILRIAEGEAWQVYEEARTAMEKESSDATRLYLMGRVIPDREVQEGIFRRAVEADPSHFFANYGLAVVLLDLGEAEEAEEFAERCLTIRPDDSNATILLFNAMT